jgi:hypothetical protein
MTQQRGNSCECHLLTLIVVALNGEPLQCAILRNEACVAAAPGGPGRKTDIVEVRRLFEIGLGVEENYRELRAGEAEGTLGLNGCEIREFRLRFASKTDLQERRAAFKARAVEGCLPVELLVREIRSLREHESVKVDPVA